MDAKVTAPRDEVVDVVPGEEGALDHVAPVVDVVGRDLPLGGVLAARGAVDVRDSLQGVALLLTQFLRQAAHVVCVPTQDFSRLQNLEEVIDIDIQVIQIVEPFGQVLPHGVEVLLGGFEGPERPGFEQHDGVAIGVVLGEVVPLGSMVGRVTLPPACGEEGRATIGGRHWQTLGWLPFS